MLVHIRRSVVLALIAARSSTFAYTFVGTGVAQVLFKHQANGSITANGSTLIGQNWSQTRCPGHPLGSCVFQGRPDALGPYAGSLNPVAGGGDNPLEANNIPGKPGVLNSGESGATNLGPRSSTLKSNTETLVAYWHKPGASIRPPTWSPPRAVGTTPTSPRPTPWPRSPWCPGPPASLRPPCGPSSPARTTAPSSASSAAATSTCSS